ncbi:MAG: hypothetical protein ACOCRU_01640 [bacterium]
MSNLVKLLVISIMLFISLFSCSNNSYQQLILTHYPEYVQEGEAFYVSGELINSTTSASQKAEIWLTVKGIDSKRVLYNDELIITDQSQKFVFEDIVLNDLDENIFFELKLIIDGNFISKIDNSNKPVLLAKWHENIRTTYFLAEDAEGNPLKSTWNKYLTEENPFYFALPYRDFYYFVDGSEEPVKKDYYGVGDVKNKWIEILYIDDQKQVLAYAQWVDVGPWNYYDPYYVFEYQRPYAEIGIDMGWSSEGYRETNKAGLDVSPDVMIYLGEQLEKDLISEGIIEVNWRFVEEDDVPDGPWKEKISTSVADIEELNLETQSLKTLE